MPYVQSDHKVKDVCQELCSFALEVYLFDAFAHNEPS